MIAEYSRKYVSPIVLVKKNNGEIRFCIDYRQLNKITIKKIYRIPIIEDEINEMRGSKIFSTLDLKSGYHKLKIKSIERHKTALLSKKCVYEWKRMLFGLVNAPFTFQKVMNKVCEEFLYKFVIVYLDDIIIFSSNHEKHLEHLKIIFERIQYFGFKLNQEKCHIMKSRIKFLGYDIYENKIHIPENLKDKFENTKDKKRT
ncbi:Transposon Ty3-I Gag-Pol polyprotein [Dictyocoela muelleri]|nr:Transposon Ty3-I Gag-Pol polyprotein [Dictyocoela muelleri]